MYGYIYLTTNLLNGKKYIGKHTYSKFDFEKYKGSGKVLKEAFNKYGKENFKCELMQEQPGFPVICNNKEELNTSECYYIDFYDAVNSRDYYNVASGGQGGNLGSVVNQKISNALKGRVISEDWRNKLRKPKSDETKKKLSLARIGKSSHMKGKHLSEETKIKISKKLLGHTTWNKGIHQPNYVKEAVRKANTNNKYRVGKHHTEETKEKIREKALLRPKRAWYNDGKIEKFILITEIDHYRALGYTRGRIGK